MQRKRAEIKTITVKYIKMTKITQNKDKFLVSLRYRIQNMEEKITQRLWEEKFPPKWRKPWVCRLRNIHHAVDIPSLSIWYPLPFPLPKKNKFSFRHPPFLHMTPVLWCPMPRVSSDWFRPILQIPLPWPQVLIQVWAWILNTSNQVNFRIFVWNVEEKLLYISGNMNSRRTFRNISYSESTINVCVCIYIHIYVCMYIY